MKFKITLLMFIVLLVVNVVGATDGLTECTLTGNHYQCTGTISGHDSFETVSESIFIFDATITLSGSTGGTASPGESVTLNIGSTNGKILIQNSVISIAGGAGGAGDGATGNPDGGAGGSAIININASYVSVENSTIISTGGHGGNADGDVTSACADANGPGGAGGHAYNIIDGSTQLLIDNSTFNANSGDGGTGDAVSCTKTGITNARVQCFWGDGGTSGNSYNYFYYDLLNSSNMSINGNPGNGGDYDTASCTQTGSTGDDEDGRGARGGNLGGALTYFDGGFTVLNDLFITYTFGTSFETDTVCLATAYDGTNSPHVEHGENGAQYVSNHLLSILSDNLSMDNGTVISSGAAGYVADSCMDKFVQGESFGYSADNANGGDGQGIVITIYNTNTGTIVDSSFTLTGGNGAQASCKAQDDNSAEDCAPPSGDGGHNTINLKNVNFSNSNITSTGGVGAVFFDRGIGGQGGRNIFNTYEINTIDDTSIVDFNGGVGGNGCTSSFTGCGPGRGGDSYFYNYGIVTINAWLDFDSGASGTGSICSVVVFDEKGGDAVMDSNNTVIFNGANLDFNAGAGSVCAPGGDSHIDNDVLIKFYDNTSFVGSAGSNSGDCENDFKGIVQLEESSWGCTASTGTAAWYGVNMTQVDYRANSSITMSGATDNDINFSYIGDVQKFLIYNSTFDDTYIYWNNESCKFTNRTPASIGTVIFNETCGNIVGWDAYYTDINNLTQEWYDGATIKPLPYSYAEYRCVINVDFPTDTINDIYANFSWFIDGAVNSSQSDVLLTSGVDYTSTQTITNVSIDDNVTCNVNVKSGSSECYQETATTATDCGGLSTGAYGSETPSYNSFVYMNYTKPVAAISATWEVKHGHEPLHYNISLPAVCFSQAPLQLRFNSSYRNCITADEYSQPQCYNGTSWEDIGQLSSGNCGGGVVSSTGISKIYDGSWSTKAVWVDLLSMWVNNLGSASGDIFEEAIRWNMNVESVTTQNITYTTVPAYPYNVKIDIGNDSVFDYEGVGVFNSTLAATYLKNGINAYLRDCTTDNCAVPIVFSNDEDTTFVFNQINSSYGVSSPISGLFNLSLAVFSSDAGVVNVNSLLFDYGIGDGDIVSFQVPNSSGGLDTLNVTIVESNFTQSLPTNILYFEMYPSRLTSQDVEPVGQETAVPIFTITNNHASENVDFYIKLENDWDTMSFPCTELEFVNSSSPGTGVEINDTSYLYCDNVSVGGTCSLWAYQDFSCTYAQVVDSVYEPNFIFDAICEDCVVSGGGV